ncbi:hypothetical protein NKH77_08300 [Streptomyces sp. M19]
MPGPEDAVMALAFSPDGRTLAVGTDDGLRLWDVAARRVRATVSARTGLVIDVSFSPDGSTLATTGNDHTVALWDARTARLYAALDGLAAPQPVARFSPAGTPWQASSDRPAPRVWNTDADDVAERVCRISTEHRWARLLPDQSVKGLCPA